MIDHNSVIYYLYQLFYRRFYGNEKYIFNPSQNMQSHISKFIELIDKKYQLDSIGLNFLITYFIFQFEYWSKLDIKERTDWSDRIQLNWIIGEKAFDRWIKRDSAFDYQLYISDFCLKYKIRRSEIKDFFKEEDDTFLNKAEEIEKARFHNEEKGLVNCLTSTTLFYHRSPLCVSCKEKIDCKKLLKVNYEQIYLVRGYN